MKISNNTLVADLLATIKDSLDDTDCLKANPGALPRGKPSNSPTETVALSPQGNPGFLDRPTLESLVEDWIRSVEDRPPKTVAEAKRSFKLLKQFCNKKGLDCYRRRTLILFRDHLLHDKKFARKTVAKHLAFIRAVYQLAYDNERLEVNHASLIRVRKPKHEKKARLRFSSEQLLSFFTSPVYSERFRPIGGAADASYWIPVIALFSGARLEEIAQLRVSHLRQHNGIWFMEITDADDSGSLKTDSSYRRIPIHPELISLGLISYLNELRLSGKDYLFPYLKPDCTNKRSGNFSKWFSRYLRKNVGITDKRIVFHSFRHTFRQACRDAQIDEEIADALMGHSSRGGTGRSYGDHYPLEPLHEAIKMIRYSSANFIPEWPSSQVY